MFFIFQNTFIYNPFNIFVVRYLKNNILMIKWQVNTCVY